MVRRPMGKSNHHKPLPECPFEKTQFMEIGKRMRFVRLWCLVGLQGISQTGAIQGSK
jgi:hypothetical protein